MLLGQGSDDFGSDEEGDQVQEEAWGLAGEELLVARERV